MSNNEPIAFCRPTIGEEEIRLVTESMRSGWITTGPRTKEFEDLFATRFNRKHSIAVNSATGGLHSVFASLGLKNGDEVLTPSMTWTSAVNVIELCGLKPVFVDVNPATLQIDCDDLESKITPKSRAVIPVHFAGQPFDLDRVNEIAKKHGLTVIEDAAHAIGTYYKGREIGTGRNICVFSFHPIKNITTGEGGIVVLDDDEQAARIKRLKFHGIEKDSWKRYNAPGSMTYDVIEPGFKYNMLDIQASIGLAQMKRLEEFNAVRTQLALRYNELLADIDEIQLPGTVGYDHTHAWHLYIIQVDTDKIGADRDTFVSHLQELKIGVGLHFHPVHIQQYYREKYNISQGFLPNTEKAGSRIVSLPLYPLLAKEQQDRVVSSIKQAIARIKNK